MSLSHTRKTAGQEAPFPRYIVYWNPSTIAGGREFGLSKPRKIGNYPTKVQDNEHDQGGEEMTEDPYARSLENEAKLKAWREAKQHEAEQRAREEKQGELQAYLRRRSQGWRDVTASEPTFAQLQRWQEEFVDGKHFEQEAERAERIARAIEENYGH